MLNNLSKLWIISRPRFWLYLLGPTIIGFTLSFQDNFVMLALLIIYFTFPANLLIYGVNDLADFETDALNPKKDGFEHRLAKSDQAWLITWIILTNLPFLLVFLFLMNGAALVALAIFLFTGIFYSLKPIRAKAIPFLDGFFNVLYAMPAMIAFLVGEYTVVNFYWILLAMLWCVGMHAFSAIPDIKADKKAGVATVATVLGYNKALIYSGVALILPCLLFLSISKMALFPAVAYAILIWRSRQAENIFAMYKLFPTVNTLVGLMLFLTLLQMRIG
jgi:4-hydroxybenzoate polyprenyltransferase